MPALPCSDNHLPHKRIKHQLEISSFNLQSSLGFAHWVLVVEHHDPFESLQA
jgi:hypothetical protein